MNSGLCIKIKQPTWVRWKAVAPARKSQKEWLLSDNDPKSCGSLNVGPVQAFREIGNLPPFTLANNFVVLQNGQKWSPWTRIGMKFYTRKTPSKIVIGKTFQNSPMLQNSSCVPPDHGLSPALLRAGCGAGVRGRRSAADDARRAPDHVRCMLRACNAHAPSLHCPPPCAAEQRRHGGRQRLQSGDRGGSDGGDARTAEEEEETANGGAGDCRVGCRGA